MVTTTTKQNPKRKKWNDAKRLYGLYAITPDAPSHGADAGILLDQLKQVIAGGARIVQYRNKFQPDAEQLAQAKSIKAICATSHVTFIVNDNLELAQACGADGVHLGKDDAGLAAARQCLGSEAIIGISCYNRLDLALQAQAQGADYVAFGRFFPSQTKPCAVPADVDLLRQAKDRLRIPIAAIGGINATNAVQLIRAGADMIAVVQDVFCHDDVTQAAYELAKHFEIGRL